MLAGFGRFVSPPQRAHEGTMSPPRRADVHACAPAHARRGGFAVATTGMLFVTEAHRGGLVMLRACVWFATSHLLQSATTGLSLSTEAHCGGVVFAVCL